MFELEKSTKVFVYLNRSCLYVIGADQILITKMLITHTMERVILTLALDAIISSFSKFR